MTDTPLVDDVAAVIDSLDRMWTDYPPETYSGKKQQPLMDSVHDQETVGVNPYWDIVRRMPLDQWGSGEGHAIQVDGYNCRIGREYIVSRDRLAKTYAWSIPTPGDIAWLKTQLDGRGVVEIGAGTGYWAWQLSQAEVDVLAFDIAPLSNHWCGEIQYHPVTEGGPEHAAEYPTRALMLCWPPYDSPMAVESLRAYQGDTLIYIGEQECGCTANDDFFKELESGWHHVGSSPAHVTFGGIHCYVEVYRRSPALRVVPGGEPA